MNESHFLSMRYGRKIETVEEIRKIQLDLLKVFHEFCGEKSINYSLAYGTLLGAIRHKGYIPWDDDIDICMLREDYEKLELLFPENYQNTYDFYTLNRSKKWNRSYGKFFNTKTIEIETSNDNVGIGVSIDIFPIDDVPDIDSFLKRVCKRNRFLTRMRTLKAIVWSKERPLLKNLVILASHVTLFPFSARLIAQRIDRYSRSQNNKGYNHVYHSCDSDAIKSSISRVAFRKYIDVPFEGFVLKAMEGYDEYLKTIYGDYLILPPIEQRVSTHSLTAFWKDA